MLSSTQGTQQGDPLGPAFFFLAIHKVVRQLYAVPELEYLVFYLDDGVVVEDPDALLSLLQKLSEEFAKLALHVNLAKCKLWSPSGILTAECPIPVVDWAAAKVVLGTPLGTQETSKHFLENIHAQHRTLLDRHAQLPDTYVATCLLRHCLGAQIFFCECCGHPI